MPLNKSTGNMYDWVTHTFNPIKGKCPHECSYCYMRIYKLPELHFDDKCVKDFLGENNTLFVGSSTDMWAECIPHKWIQDSLNLCVKYNKNTYLFQSKNPARFFEDWKFPNKYILATTIETNREYDTKAPQPHERYEAIRRIKTTKAISIEPIMDFDLDILVQWIKDIRPNFVSIGADSKHSGLKEPDSEKVKSLIEELRKFTNVKIKTNLKRLSGD